jgi:hypothetical protein
MEFKRMRLVSHVARMVEMRNVYKVFVGRREWKEQLGRRKRRWENNTGVERLTENWILIWLILKLFIDAV